MANAWFDDSVTPELDGFSTNQQPTFITSEYASGRRRNRKLYTAAPYDTAQSFVMNPGQYRVFCSWWQASTGADYGQAEFFMPCHISESVGNWVVRPVGMYSAEKHGPNMWRVSINANLIESPHFSGDYYDYYPELIEFAGVFDLAINRELPV